MEACKYEKNNQKKLGYQSTWSCKLSCTLPDGIYGNLACNWLYYQEEEPEEVKKMRKF